MTKYGWWGVSFELTLDGEDAMQVRVCELMEELDCEAEDIMVFDKEMEL